MASGEQRFLRWEAGDMIYRPDGSMWWSRSHAQAPRALDLGGDRTRIVFSTRDDEGRTRPGFIDVATSDPREILAVGREPLLDLGAPGAFDDRGVMPACFFTGDDGLYLFYTGWNTGGTVPYRLSLGLAVSTDGGDSFRKIGPGPVMDRSLHEPISCSQPYVMRHNGGYRMYYLSIYAWKEINGRMESYYNLRFVDSDSLVRWNPQGRVAIDCDDEFTKAIAVPSVWMEDGTYRMIYSFRSDGDFRTDPELSYRLGYAVSADGDHWERADGHLDLPRCGWDSEMQAYPDYFSSGSGDYVFYSGNGFGREGFGFARRIR